MTIHDLFDNSIIPLLWGRNSGTATLPRILTPEEQIVRTIRRGGYPLLRQDSCQRPLRMAGTSVHAYLEALLGQSLLSAVMPRPAARQVTTA